MPEATMICCDCSEWMRNGDLVPNRFDSQIDAVGLISNRKTEENHENTVGLISMGKHGKAEVLVNCTGDVGRVLSSLSKMKMEGKADILVALQTAQLALKHRKNKKQDQRIILFVGSPVVASEKQLIKAGKRLKKNNVAVDIISFGETDDNKGILEALINAVKSNDNSNLVEIESNKLISDALIGTPIFGMGGGDFGMGGGVGESEEAQIAAATAASQAMANNNNNGNDAFAEYGGIDPNMDPEMAMAIRMSLQEERQRQQNEQKNENNDSNANANDSNKGSHDSGVNVGVNAGANGTGSGDSNTNANANQDSNSSNNNNNNENNENNENNDGDNEDIDMEDEDLLAALKMSLMTDDNDDGGNADANTNANTGDGNTKDDDDDEQAMLNDLLSDLPGLNADDIGDLLQDGNDGDDKDKDKDKETK